MPTCPLGSEVVVMASVGETTVSVRFTVFDCCGVLESFTWKVNARLLTAAVGVPVIAPVEAFKLAQDSKLPLDTDQVNGIVPPVAARVVE
jgi:hypothetical protein